MTRWGTEPHSSTQKGGETREYGRLRDAINARFVGTDYEDDDYLTVATFNSLRDVYVTQRSRAEFDRDFEYVVQRYLESETCMWLRTYDAALRLGVHPPEDTPTGTDCYRLYDLINVAWHVAIADAKARNLPPSETEYYPTTEP